MSFLRWVLLVFFALQWVSQGEFFVFLLYDEFLKVSFFVFFALRWVSQGEVVKCQMYKNKTALGHCIVTLVPFCVGFLSNSDSVIFFRLEIRYLNVYRYRVNLYIYFCIKTVAFIDLINGRHWMWGGCWGEQHRFYFIFNQCFDRRSHLVKIWTKFIRTRSMGPGFSKSHSLSITLKEIFCNLTDVTLADEDTNSIQTDTANRAIQGNVSMQVFVFRTNVWWPKLEPK